MRDIYNRKQRLNYCIARIYSDFSGKDKTDLLKFLEIMQEKEQSALTIIRCISVMTQIQQYLKISFCNITKEDIKKLFRWMEYEKEHKVETQEKFRAVLKKFYKMIYGDNQNYPDCVKWFSVKLGREKKNKEKNLDIAAFLEEEEIKRLVNAAPTTQKKAFLGCLYESGARPEEFLRITNLDCKIDTNGAVLMLRGKTGERRVRIISFAKLLQEWLDINPLKNQNEFPIWISEATNHKNNPIGLGGAENIIKEALYKAGLENKDKRLYVLRHSRATHLCKHLTESQLCVFFGWNQGTKVVRRYIHLSGKDLDNTLISIGHGKEIIQQKEYQLKTTKCNRCCEVLGPTQQFCSKCGLVCDLSEQYSLENKIQNENTELKKQILEIRNNNKIKDDVLTNLSDQLITLIGKVKELEQRKNLLCNPL